MKRAMRLIAATLLLVVAFLGAMQAKDDEIAALKARLEDKVKAECNLI